MLASQIALVLAASLAASVSAQYLATDELHSLPQYTNADNSTYYAGPGGWQEVLYEDMTNSLGVTTNMVWTMIHIDPCGVELPQYHTGFTELSYIVQGTVIGARINSRGSGAPDNDVLSGPFPPGSVVPVAPSVIHSAENPSCTEPVVLMQALYGGPQYLHTDILTGLVAMSPSSVQYGMYLPNGTLAASAAQMRPIFAYNTECLARCGLTAPGPSAAGPTPSLSQAG